MTEAVHDVAHEATHEAAHSGSGNARLIGLLISLLALCLAVSEMLGKSAQTQGLALNIQASDTWNFFQAKTIRQTVVRTALESAKLQQSGDKPELDKQIAAWQLAVSRLESEPSTNEGRKELRQRASDMEHERDRALGQYHAYEIASLILQLGIVLASVALLSSITAFAFGSVILGGAGLALLAGTFFELPFVLALLH